MVRLFNIRRVAQVELPSHYGIFSSVRDLARWDNALVAGKVVNQPSLKQMWTPVQLNSGASFPYGFGWAIAESQGHRMITHSGITGVEYTRFPDDKVRSDCADQSWQADQPDRDEFMGLNERSRRAPCPDS